MIGLFDDLFYLFDDYPLHYGLVIIELALVFQLTRGRRDGPIQVHGDTLFENRAGFINDKLVTP